MTTGAAAAPERSPTTAYLVAFTILGVSLSMVGPALPHLRAQAGVGIGAGGLIVGGQGVGYVAASLLAGRLVDARGAGHGLLLAAAAGATATTAVLSFTDQLAVITIAFMVIGACCGLIDVTANTLLVWFEDPAKIGSRLNALHLRFGIGAIAAPLLVAASLAVRDDLLIVTVALAIGVVATAALLRGITTPRAADRPRPADRAATAGRPARGLLVLGAAFFVLYVGAEGGFGAWSTTYAEGIDLGVDVSPALLTAVYWGGFTIGRVATVHAAKTRSVDRILTVSCAAATAAAVVLLVVDVVPVATWAMVAIFGFCFGPQYATMLAVVDRRIGLDGRATSILVASAGAGGLVIPVATGWILDAAGVEALPAVAAVAIGGAWLLAVLVVARHPAPVRPPVPVAPPAAR